VKDSLIKLGAYSFSPEAFGYTDIEDSRNARGGLVPMINSCTSSTSQKSRSSSTSQELMNYGGRTNHGMTPEETLPIFCWIHHGSDETDELLIVISYSDGYSVSRHCI
jgi:hypothetical protein